MAANATPERFSLQQLTFGYILASEQDKTTVPARGPLCEVNMRIRSSALLPCLASLPIAAFLAGCSGMTPTATDPVVQGLSIQGKVHGGQQPIVGAHVYLLAANTAAGSTDGGPGVAPTSTNASVSTLVASSTGLSDSIGAYVLTTTGGSFTITGDYSCTPGTQLYLYALGGNTGTSTANPAAGLLAALGSCPSSQSFAAASPYVFINEVSTVAAAYALAGYATDATHISSDVVPVSRTGIANAFLNSPNLENIATGVALTTTPAGNGTAPQAMVNTLANILSACINSTNTATAPSSQCTTLFANARFSGSTGTTPTDTATAAINIAHNPGSNIATLYGLSPASPPFLPALTSVPNDFLLGINYSGQGQTSGGLNGAYSIAIDAQGAAWFTNVNNNSVTKLSSTGVPLSPAGGFSAGGIPTGIAIDPSGNAWVVDAASNALREFASNGSVLSPANGYQGGGLMVPQGIAIDGQGNIFATNFGGSQPASVSKFSNAGVAISPANTGYTGGGLAHTTSITLDNYGSVWVADQAPTPGTLSKLTATGSPLSAAGFPGGGTNNPQAVATDANANIWAANDSGNSLTKLNGSNGTPFSSSSGYIGGGLTNPKALAIDGNGNVWVANAGSSTISEFTNSGTPTSPSTGFAVGGVSAPLAIEIDQSGNVWVANNPPSGSAINAVTELIGAAVPRTVPLSVGVANGTLGTRP
jgi:streptogramin lyase